MKKIIFLVTLLFIVKLLQAQELYLKPILRYNLSISTQAAPQYFTLPNLYLPISSSIKEFSLSSGFKYGGTLGYRFNESIGLELDLEYFNPDRTIEADKVRSAFIGTTNWNFKSFNTIPSFIFSKNFNKSVLTGKIGVLIGVSRLVNSIYIENSIERYNKTYLLSKELSLGYLLGLEYNYFVKPNFAFFFEFGEEHYSYSPSSASLTENFVYKSKITNNSISVEKIEYRDKIEGYIADPNKPEVRIKETINMNSIYFGIGFKLIMSKNEKN